MKTIARILLSAATLALFAVSHAQYLYLNGILNGGFENSATSISPWIDYNSYFDDGEGDRIYTPLGHMTTSGHTGYWAYDMGLSANEFEDNRLQQFFANYTVPANQVYSATVWGKAFGTQTLYVTIYYSDGTLSNGSHFFDYYSAPQGSNGWQQWNFYSVINTSKRISGIEFHCDNGEGNDMLIDDASLMYWIPFDPI